MGFASRNPGSGAAVGFAASVIVSPMRESATRLIPAVRKPTWPVASSSTCTICGEKTPTCWTSKTLPFDMSRIFMPGATRPSITRT